MWTVIYLDREDKVVNKGGFKSDAEAFGWINQNHNNINPLSINVWSELTKQLRSVYKIKNGRWETL